jgi:hypothetical protein
VDDVARIENRGYFCGEVLNELSLLMVHEGPWKIEVIKGQFLSPG